MNTVENWWTKTVKNTFRNICGEIHCVRLRKQNSNEMILGFGFGIVEHIEFWFGNAQIFIWSCELWCVYLEYEHFYLKPIDELCRDTQTSHFKHCFTIPSQQMKRSHQIACSAFETFVWFIHHCRRIIWWKNKSRQTSTNAWQISTLSSQR